jgi:hypothetical protein
VQHGRVVWVGIDGKRWETAKKFWDDKDVEITIGPPRKKGTARQRSYYFKVIVTRIAIAAGCDPSEYKEQVHEALKARFLKIEIDGPLPITKRYETLTTVEREEYHENCRRFGAEFFGIYIPLPNEMEEAA